MMYYGVNDSISYIPNNMRNIFLNKDTKKTPKTASLKPKY